MRYEVLTEILRKAMDFVRERNHKSTMENFGRQYIDGIAQKSRRDHASAGDIAEDFIKEHLSEDLSVTMVSNSVGFNQYSYFTEQFKKYYGITPRDYQKRYKLRENWT